MRRESVVTSFKPHDHNHQVCVNEALSDAEALCRSKGVRLTEIRRRVLELIWRQHEPVGAYDLLDVLRRERSGAAPPTVYRALDFLLENGLVHRIESLNAYVGCGAPSTTHAGQFLICRDCHTVGELDDGEIAALVAKKAKDIGFEVRRQTIEVMGLCPDCAGSSRDT